jgi:acetylornithine/N-succinyldiaminopimelate aminotransferase
MLKEKLVENSEAMGNYLIQKLSLLSKKYNFITEVRGMGLMIGVQLSIDKANDIKNKCFEKGYLIGTVGKNIIRLLPPLIISKQDIDSLLDVLDSILSDF